MLGSKKKQERPIQGGHEKNLGDILGGGNSNIFGIFTPKPWGDDPI